MLVTCLHSGEKIPHSYLGETIDGYLSWAKRKAIVLSQVTVWLVRI